MQKPPQIFLRFFRWFCDPQLRKYIEGDLMELYHERIGRNGKRSADVRFIGDVLLLFRPGIIKLFTVHPSNHRAMIKSYFTIGWRNLLRNKGYAVINIGGLAIGMAVATLIGLWIYDEISYDKNFINYNRIARVMQNQTFDGNVETWGSQAMQLGPELRNNFGNYFEHVVIGTFPGSHKLTFQTKTVILTGSFVEPPFAEMLSLKIISGTRDPNGVLLSKTAAQSLFGNENPVNKSVRADLEFDVVVSGVYEDLPDNTSFSNNQIVLPWRLIAPAMEKRVRWGNNWFQCLVLLNDHVNMNAASEAINDVKRKAVSAQGEDDKTNPQLFLHPMSRWRLYSEFENGKSIGGQIGYVRMFGLIGTFVLLLACINFMNLCTARSEKRAREVGIRKSIGSLRTQLVTQFFSESVLIALLAAVVALMMVQLTLPWFNAIAGKNLTLLASPWFWLAFAGFAIFTGLISGTYPALFLSSFQPVKVLKGTFKAEGHAVPRKALVVLQFTVSITLVVSTLIIFRQIIFAQERPVGYDISQIVSVPIRDGIIMPHYEALRDELLKTGVVEEVAASETPVTATFTTNSGFTWQGKDPNRMEEFVTSGVTYEFGKTLGWKVKEGRDFSRDVPTDSSAFVINEAAAKYLGIENPIGETMKWGNNGEWKIIGIVENMVTQSPYSSVKPMLFFLESRPIQWIQFGQVNLRLKTSVNIAAAMGQIGDVFKKYDPENAFSFNFADQEFGKKFDSERRIANLALGSTILAILISCLGLFGLASFVAAQRTKEIGIRKIMGASVSQLWQLLSRDFVILVFISCVISIPLSFYFMSEWLTQFEYRIGISWEMYAAACTGALLITLLTVSVQSLKTALSNPVNSLRSE